MEAESDVDENMGEGDGGLIVSCEEAEKRPSYSGRKGRRGGKYRRQGGLSTAFRQGKGKGAIAIERD